MSAEDQSSAGEVHPIADPVVQDLMKRTEAHARTLAAYALNMLYGAELYDFEVKNLKELAARYGVLISTDMQRRIEAKVKKAADHAKQVEELVEENRALRRRRQWWKFW